MAIGGETAEKSKSEGSISGSVVDGGGKAIGGARVQLFQYDDKLRGYETILKELKTDEGGKFEFPRLPDGGYIVCAQREGVGRAWVSTILQDALQQRFEIALRPMAAPTIQVRDESGKPIVAAHVRTLKVRDTNGSLSLREASAGTFTALALESQPTDAAGVLRLPDLPEKSFVGATIDHPDFVSVNISTAAVKPGVIAEAKMHSGTKVKFRISNPVDSKLPSVRLTLNNWDDESASEYHKYSLALGADGSATITIAPGKYRLIELENEDSIITPVYRKNGLFEAIEIPASNQEFTFTLHRKQRVSGKLVDAVTGKPIKDAWVSAAISNQPVSDWNTAAYGDTDADGKFKLEAPAGKVLVSASADNYTMVKAYVEEEVRDDGPTTWEEIKLTPNPKITGRVIDAEGKPVAGAVIRLRGIFNFFRHPPASTDADGRFELQVRRIPENFDEPNARELAWVHPLDAFDPTRPLSARVMLHLDQPESYTGMTIQLQPEDCDAFLERAKAPTREWARKALALRKESAKKREAWIGQPAPELDGAVWINTDKPAMSLEDFQGKYVLLDFWTVWCGPCHADFPVIKLLHDLYKDRGFVVIGVHNNSVDADSVCEHVKQQGLTFPIVVDQRDGRILQKYDALVGGYPSYVLIGPDGKIVETETNLFQIEYARKYLFSSKRQ